MAQILLSEVVGQKGIFSLMNYFFESNHIVSSEDLDSFLSENFISEALLSDLVENGLINTNPSGFFLSNLGEKVSLLLLGINSKMDLAEVYRRLTLSHPELKTFELIIKDVTGFFLNMLLHRADFIRLYICSPWIMLDNDNLTKLELAIKKAEDRYKRIQIYIITLPTKKYRDDRAIATLYKLKELGAEIVTNKNLHAKLYISEPGPLGGIHYAIVGSENLTGRKNIEIGIKIERDNAILRKLTEFVVNVRTESHLLREVTDE